MIYYNNHSHIFTMNNAPARFLHLFLPDWLASFINKSTNTQVGAAIFEKLLSLGGKMGKRYASFLTIGKSKNQLEVFKGLMAAYQEPQMKFVALTMYMEEIGAGHSASGYEGQLEEILRVKQQYPDRLLIFLGIDPRWKEGEDLKKTVENYFSTPLDIGGGKTVPPFAGLKLYPSNGFYPFDSRLRPLFEWAAENEVPLLSHCNYLGGIFSNNSTYIKANLRQTDSFTHDTYPSRGNEPKYQGKEKTSGNRNNCSYFMEPNSFRSLLQYFEDQKKPLKLCLAHYGGSDHILNQFGKKQLNEQELFSVRKQNWCGQIRDLITSFSQVYTDISFALAHPETHECFFEDLEDKNYRDKLLYGTDFFLTEQVLTEKEDYTTFRQKAVQRILSNNRTAWDQIAGINTSHFLQSKYYQP